jgi:predicted pyridoxine 5'-phosphate oxidase superfamily flavin-nucleotide-binding protein
MQQEQTIRQRIERARELLHTVRHVALATVNEDGSLHNAPVFAGCGDGTTMILGVVA